MAKRSIGNSTRWLSPISRRREARWPGQDEPQRTPRAQRRCPETDSPRGKPSNDFLALCGGAMVLGVGHLTRPESGSKRLRIRTLFLLPSLCPLWPAMKPSEAHGTHAVRPSIRDARVRRQPVNSRTLAEGRCRKPASGEWPRMQRSPGWSFHPCLHFVSFRSGRCLG
jgi:hypothetical protein